MVELVPVEFWEWALPIIKTEHAELIFIAEVYNPDLYQNYLFKGKFDCLYDKVGLYDTLRALVEEKGNANQISNVWQQQEGFGERMLRFMENHDEQRMASDFVGKNAEKTLPAMAISAFMGKGPLMVYFGQELGEKAEGSAGFSGDDGKTTIFDYWHVPGIQKWDNEGNWNNEKLNDAELWLRNQYKNIIHFSQNGVIEKGKFFDLQYANHGNGQYDSNKIYSFLRYDKDDIYLFINTFDIETAIIKLIVPHEAWHALGISNEVRCRLKKVIEGSNEIDFYVKTSFWSEGNSAGILMPVKPFEYQIWKLDEIG